MTLEDEIDAVAALARLREVLGQEGWSTVGLGQDEPAAGRTRGTLRFAFGLDQFAHAALVTGRSAEGLWPGDRLQSRAVKLMLVHIDEDIATRTEGETDLVLSFVDGMARVRPESWALPVDTDDRG